MKKRLALLGVLAALGFASVPATAAPVGWYQLTSTWRDGSFEGKLYYDPASPYLVTQVQGNLKDIAHETAITDVWNVSHASTDAPLFFDNASGPDIDGYDTGFYLNLVDLGATLGIDTGLDNGLYDWSSDFAFYPRLDDSPLQAWRITAPAAVPEPATAALLALGLLAGLGAGRRLPSRHAGRSA